MTDIFRINLIVYVSAYSQLNNYDRVVRILFWALTLSRSEVRDSTFKHPYLSILDIKPYSIVNMVNILIKGLTGETGS